MPAYNAANTIAESIESVLNQTYENWELLIINDCSKDNTASIVNSYTSQFDNIKLIDFKANKGVCIARNEGIKAATGEYICFLDSDDLWLPSKLELQTELHRKNNFAISHTDFYSFDANGIVKRPWSKIMEIGQLKSGDLLRQLYHKNTVGILTVMVQKKVLVDMNGFDPKVPSLEDYDLWIRIAEAGHQFGYLDIKLARYRIVSGSLSNSTNKYKRVFKKFIYKHISKHRSDVALIDKIWGNYYRHFGTMYFKSQQYRLSAKYFIKSITCSKISFISLTTIVYLLLAILKQKKFI